MTRILSPLKVKMSQPSTSMRTPSEARVPVKVLNRIFLGEHTEYRVASEALGEFMVMAPRKSEREAGVHDIGDMIAVGWRAESERLLPDD